MNTNTSETIIDIFPLFRKIGDDTEYDYTRLFLLQLDHELKNNYDLRTFPFDKQKLIFKIANVNKLMITYRLQNLYSRALDNYVKMGL